MHPQFNCPDTHLSEEQSPFFRLTQELEKKLKSMGDFTYAYFTTAKTRKVKPVILSNYPDPWLKLYVAANYHLIDPIINYALRSIKPFFWQEVRQQANDICTHDFFRRSEQYQLSSGATFTLHDATGLFASLSLCNIAHEDDFEQRVRYHGAEIQMALIRFHDQLLAIKPMCELFSEPQDNQLSTRELGILKWVVMGKAYSEIADIFSISERTVKFHMSNVSSKLHVRNAKQAVYKAINMGMV